MAIAKYVTTNVNTDTVVDMGTRCSEVTVYNRQAAPTAPGNELYIRVDGKPAAASDPGSIWVPAIYGASSPPLVCVNPDIVDEQISATNTIVHVFSTAATLIVVID